MCNSCFPDKLFTPRGCVPCGVFLDVSSLLPCVAGCGLLTLSCPSTRLFETSGLLRKTVLLPVWRFLSHFQSLTSCRSGFVLLRCTSSDLIDAPYLASVTEKPS